MRLRETAGRILNHRAKLSNPAIEKLLEADAGSTNITGVEYDPARAAAKALDELFLQAQGKEWRNRYDVALSKVKPVGGGDPVAMEAYARIVREHVERLNSLIVSHREFLLAYSRKCFNWPVCIGKRKPFGDDADDIISKLQVGAETIANDPNARFNPNGKFGKIVMAVLERIDDAHVVGRCYFVAPRSWEYAARELPAFTLNPTPENKRAWIKVINQVLEDDFRDPEIANYYLSLLTKPSYKQRGKAVFFDKIRNGFETLWGSRR
jgi:hypothetical protein